MRTSYYKVINVLQGKTARWIEGVTEAHGLYTDEVTTCKIFIFFGTKDGKKAVSMSHFDGYSDIEHLKHEYDWFDQVDNFYICWKPTEHKDEIKNYFENIFKPKIETVFNSVSNKPNYLVFGNDSDNNDSVIAMYDPNENNKKSVRWLNSQQLENYNYILINHPEAQKIYAYYKTNIMFSEIEGDMKLVELSNKKEVIWLADTNYYMHQASKKHVIDLCKELATPIQHNNLIFDGMNFCECYDHDKSLSQFSKDILNKFLKIDLSNMEFNDFCTMFAQFLANMEREKFGHEHKPRDWYLDPQTFYIAENSIYALDLQIPLSLNYLAKIVKYGDEFNKGRELEFNKKEGTPKMRPFS